MGYHTVQSTLMTYQIQPLLSYNVLLINQSDRDIDIVNKTQTKH